MQEKTTTSTDALCRGLPNEFVTYLNHTRGLDFDERADYRYLRNIFRDLFVREGFKYDYIISA